MENDEFTVGGKDSRQTAKDAYGNLQSYRQQVIDMGRLMAELTIPSVMPPEGYKAGDNLPGNNNSLGAQCVNSLANALMFMAFPPGQPIVRFEPVEFAIQEEVDNDPSLWAKTELAMSRLEMAHRKRLKATTIATAYVGYLKLLLVAGNALWKHVKLKKPCYYTPEHYVVQRDTSGLPLLTILEEKVAFATLDEDHKQQVLSHSSTKFQHADKWWEEEVTIQSVLKYKAGEDGGAGSWLYWQEYEGERLEGTAVETDEDSPPMWPGWLIPVYGQNWGRSYCEEYRGDLYTVEAHSSAINDGASLAALSLLFVRPGGTSIKQVREAKNLSTLPGDAADLSVFRSEKGGDFNFVANNLEQVGRRLSAAFLLQSAIQRSGERVTAEEIRRLGQELDKALGGLYTQIAQGNQKVIIVRAMRLHEEENKRLPSIPTNVVEIQVVTGVDALGQSTEADALEDYAAKGSVAFPNSFEAVHDAMDYFNRLAAAKGIKPDGLVKKPEQLEADRASSQQQALTQQLVDKGTGPAIKGMADMANSGQFALPQQ